MYNECNGVYYVRTYAIVYCTSCNYAYMYVYTNRSELGKNINTDEAAALGMLIQICTF